MEKVHSRSVRSRKGFMGWILGILLAILVVGLVASVLFYNAPYMTGPGPYYYYPHPFFGFFFFPLGFILFFIFIFFIVRLAFRPWRRGYYGHWRTWDDAHEILRQRYARGEITKDQFEQMQRDLDQHK